MIRKTILAATVIAASLAAGVLAAERATFILTDGSRQSGEVVFHGSGNRNIIDNFLNLGQGGAPEKTFPMDQVAVIDFAGDQPSANEFQQMPADNAGTHLIVLRSGAVQRGKLLNMVNGDTVQWQNENGQQQSFAIHDVSRVYLSPSAARRIYPQFASIQPTGATGTSGVVDQPVPAGAIRVPANTQWVPTNFVVRKGQRLAFSTSGQVQWSGDASATAGPDGNPALRNESLPVPSMNVGGLIGRVGAGQPFPIGANSQPIVMPDAGPLMLGVNDNQVSDNAGSFVVTITNVGR
jgi:hypothetical protein